MHSPLARHLARFPAAITGAPPAMLPVAPPQPELPAEPQVTLTMAEFEARLEAVRRAALGEATADHERLVAALRSECEAAVATAAADAAATSRARYVASGAERLDQEIAAAFSALRATLSDGLAEALRPLVADALVERAVAELGEALDRLLADPDHPAVVVRGPADLLAALGSRPGSRRGLEFQETDGDEITVMADGARVETRLSAAFAALKAEAA